MDEDEFEKRLRELCIQYDLKSGTYPESELEGEAIYREYVEQFPDWNEKLTSFIKESDDCGVKRYHPLW